MGNITTLPNRLLTWRGRYSWGAAHITPKCSLAFMENPGVWGVERMRSVSRHKAFRVLDMAVCAECYVTLIEARQVGQRVREARNG